MDRNWKARKEHQETMDDTVRKLGNTRTKTGHPIPRENGARFVVITMNNSQPRGTENYPLTP